MLAGARGADGELAVHAVGQADVDGVDGFVVGDAVEGLVGVDGGFGDAVHGGVFLALGLGVAGDEGGDLGGLRVGAGAHEDVGDGAEADGGVADGALGGGRGCLREGWDTGAG
jgi:hypothetical protein